MYKTDITLKRTLRTAPKEVCVIERVDCTKVLLDTTTTTTTTTNNNNFDNNNNNNNFLEL